MWKDETSYSQGDRIRIPRAWVFRTGWVRISVVRHIDSPEIWSMTANVGRLTQLTALSNDLEEAKAEAIGRTKGELISGLAYLS